MDIDKQKEDFNKSMVRAVAAAGGWTVAEWSQDVDLIDTTLSKSISIGGGQIRVQSIDFQLKCTESPTADNNKFVSFSLKSKHFDALVRRKFGAPFILCVAVVPENVDHWCQLITDSKASHRNMLLKHCSYAKILYDHENLLDEENKTVRFYKECDEFSVENLAKMESLMGSSEYNLQKLKTELAHWEAQQ